VKAAASLTARIASRREALGDAVAAILEQARVPGAGVAIATADGGVLAEGIGYRDRAQRLAMTADTIYPIASTSKAFNATYLAMLVDAGLLDWDVPAVRYWPKFCYGGDASGAITLRDLVIMRTGMPRHDWAWLGRRIATGDLAERAAHLPPAAGFREKFLYNNISVTLSGHLAECVTGQPWADAIRERILDPLGMTATSFAPPGLSADVTCSYHETAARALVPTIGLHGLATAPSGGAMHSSVADMGRWVAANLGGFRTPKLPLSPASADTLYTPQIFAGHDPGAPSVTADYALGWFVDRFAGERRVSHGGYSRDVDSEVTMFPNRGLGIVSFTNFGCPTMARLINETVAHDLLALDGPAPDPADRLRAYEAKVGTRQAEIAALPPDQPLGAGRTSADFVGTYANPGYGDVTIRAERDRLTLTLGEVTVPLAHRRDGVWAPAGTDLFRVHGPHAFDRASEIIFEIGRDAPASACSLALEPMVPAIRFSRITTER
jgi:CubicO group peptidase (beta-lactamase class C family)